MINIFKSIKIQFNNPPKKKIVIFDGESSNDLNHIFNKYDCFILEVRKKRVKEFYFTSSIFFKIIKNFRGNLYNSYLISILEIINPDLVVTVIDNSFKFFDIAKMMYKKINFVAIQSGARYDLKIHEHKKKIKINSTDFRKKYFIPNLFSLGDFEIDDYKKNNINVNKITAVGSLRFSNFLRDENININDYSKKDYDICLLTDGCTTGMNEAYGIKTLESGFAKMASFTIRYCIKNNLRFICALKKTTQGNSSKTKNIELQFYEKYLEPKEFKYLMDNHVSRENDKYISYKTMLKSNILISTYSTMLREKLSIGEKILSCNFTESNIYDFPIEGICEIKNSNYEEFEKRIEEIISISNENYFSKISKDKNYLTVFNKNNSTIDKIQKKLATFSNNINFARRGFSH